jgi:hypothetical protein
MCPAVQQIAVGPVLQQCCVYSVGSIAVAFVPCVLLLWYLDVYVTVRIWPEEMLIL